MRESTPTPQLTRPVLTTAEAADYLGLPKGTLEVWRSRARKGGPPFVRLGRTIRYRVAALDAFLLEQEEGGKGS